MGKLTELQRRKEHRFSTRLTLLNLSAEHSRSSSALTQLVCFLPPEWEVLPGHPGSCSQSEGSGWEGHRPGHRDRNRPAVHDGRHCRSWLLLCCRGTDALPVCTGWGLYIIRGKRCHPFPPIHCVLTPKKNMCVICQTINFSCESKGSLTSNLTLGWKAVLYCPFWLKDSGLFHLWWSDVWLWSHTQLWCHSTPVSHCSKVRS